MQFPGLCKLGLGLASSECQHRIQILHYSIIKYSFSITKKESLTYLFIVEMLLILVGTVAVYGVSSENGDLDLSGKGS